MDLDQDAPWQRWSALEARAAGTAFQSRAFIEPLSKRLVPAMGRRAFLIEIADGAGPALAAILATRRWFGATIIEFAGLGYADFCGPLVRQGFQITDETLRQLDALLETRLPAHDALILKRMTDAIDGQLNPFAMLPGVSEMGCGTFQLPPGTRISGASGTIRNHERKARKLLREGGTIRRITCPREALAALERAFHWRASSSDEQSWLASPLAHPAAQDFYRQVISEGVASGHSVLHQVEAAKEPIALVHGFVHGGRYHGSLMAVDRSAPSTRTYSPGQIGVLAAITEHLASGAGAVDLGAGNNEYKTHLRGEYRSQMMLTRARTTIGTLAVTRARLHDAARHWMRAHPETARLIREWRGQ